MTATAWRGEPPRTDDEARDRIVDATIRCVDRVGPKATGVSSVAAELGITRQTLYRYFSGTHELLQAASIAAAGPFITRIVDHCAPLDDPVDVIVESAAFAIEHLPDDRFLTLLIATGRSEVFARGVTSPTAMAFGRSLLDRLPVPWADLGYSPEDLDELLELLLRLLQSFMLDPDTSTRDPDALRAFLRRWIAPALDARHESRTSP